MQTIEAGKQKTKKETKRSGESPDGKWLAFIKDYNLCVRNLESEKEFPLSNDGTEEDAYSKRFRWSGDSEKIVVLRNQKGDERKIHLIES